MTTSAAATQALAAAMPKVPKTPSAIGWVSGKVPLPEAVVTTGTPLASAKRARAP